MSKTIQTLLKIQTENRKHMNAIIEGLSRCQKYYTTHKGDTEFSEAYPKLIQSDIHEFYKACTDVVCGEFDNLLTEFDGKITIDIYEDNNE